jgi:hypothetical protein
VVCPPSWVQFSICALFYLFLGEEFCIGCHTRNTITFYNHDVLEIPAYINVTIHVTLFWIITKHKGKIHGLEMMLGWLHWLFDFTLPFVSF